MMRLVILTLVIENIVALIKLPITATTNNMYYFVNISFGSNEQELELLIDTSTSWLWVNGHNCQECENKFDSTLSQTFSKTNTLDTLNYNMGQVTGYMVSD